MLTETRIHLTMRKLELPAFGETELYDESVSSLSDAQLRSKFQTNRSHVVAAFNDFAEESATRTWCNLPRAEHGQDNAIIVGNLTKGELVSLYDKGVVRSEGRPRKIYDQIKLSAHGECPYCGGIGDMGQRGELGTTDHFLPKSRFPVYSVLPANLVPACQVCNKGMGSNFPTNPNLQPLHPYLDDAHFFEEKWTTASVREEDPIVVDFDVDPPGSWSAKDRQRVLKHFVDCNLQSRYRSRVYNEVAPLIEQRNTSLKSLSADDFRFHLSVIASMPELPINGWKRTLYYALAASAWFCAKDFT